jgi:hypothetical protein
MFNQRWIGIILYSLGISIAAIGAAKMPQDGNTWSDTVYWFNDGVILTLLGLWIWRSSPVEKKEENLGKERTPIQLIREIQPILDDLYRNVDDLECYQIQEYVNILRQQYLLPLERVRNQIVAKIGLEKSAELLIAISYGERIINRIHSASLDGHHDEAVECTEEAHGAFLVVLELTRKLLT